MCLFRCGETLDNIIAAQLRKVSSDFPRNRVFIREPKCWCKLLVHTLNKHGVLSVLYMPKQEKTGAQTTTQHLVLTQDNVVLQVPLSFLSSISSFNVCRHGNTFDYRQCS